MTEKKGSWHSNQSGQYRSMCNILSNKLVGASPLKIKNMCRFYGPFHSVKILDPLDLYWLIYSSTYRHLKLSTTSVNYARHDVMQSPNIFRVQYVVYNEEAGSKEIFRSHDQLMN